MSNLGRIEGNKSQRSSKASAWLRELDRTYASYVDDAKSGTICVLGDVIDFPSERTKDSTKVYVLNEDVASCTVRVLNDNPEKTVCILNFASYSHPGGGFLSGAIAQEEALCHVTGLYPCLSQDICKPYYTEAKKEDRISSSYIYTKNCPLVDGKTVYMVDVLTMAAVNRNAKYHGPDKLMRDCQRTAYLVPKQFGADIVLLGAWGCGVFGNDPKFIAGNWNQMKMLFNGLYEKVYHPVIGPAYYVFERTIQR